MELSFNRIISLLKKLMESGYNMNEEETIDLSKIFKEGDSKELKLKKLIALRKLLDEIDPCEEECYIKAKKKQLKKFSNGKLEGKGE